MLCACLILVQLNNVDLREVPHQRAVSTFHSAGDTVTLLVERGAEQRIRVSHITPPFAAILTQYLLFFRVAVVDCVYPVLLMPHLFQDQMTVSQTLSDELLPINDHQENVGCKLCLLNLHICSEWCYVIHLAGTKCFNVCMEVRMIQ